MSEAKRGCGYRKIGGLYLVCEPGIQLVCDGLPLELEPCDCCGFAPPFSRNLQRIQLKYIVQAQMRKHKARTPKEFSDKCSCSPFCPMCYPENQPMPSFGLMFVGKKFYTPETFIKEALEMGISKRIPEIPNWLILGETWIFLAHNEVPKVSLEQLKINGMHMKEPEKTRAIFYGFKPSRIEMPVWKDEISNEEIQILEKKGITPVLLEPTIENRKRHGRTQNFSMLKRLLQPPKEEETDE